MKMKVNVQLVKIYNFKIWTQIITKKINGLQINCRFPLKFQSYNRDQKVDYLVTILLNKKVKILYVLFYCLIFKF
jgi:hypothetical protein